MRKKGGMELSINAIVILIIAMVVLGIGILFIRGMFAKAQTTTFKALTSQETTNPASADRPLIADREVTVSPNNPTATIQASIFNSGTTKVTGVNLTLGSCSAPGTTIDTSKNDVTFSTITGISIEPNTFQSYQAIIGVNTSKVPVGSAVTCLLQTGGSISQSTSIIVKVQASS